MHLGIFSYSIVRVSFPAMASAATVLARKRDAEGKDALISAADVMQYTLDVDRQKPAARIIMQDLRIMEMIFLLHLAEERGDALLYVTALKFCAVVFAVTHATKYIFMLSKFFQGIRISSETLPELLLYR